LIEWVIKHSLKLLWGARPLTRFDVIAKFIRINGIISDSPYYTGVRLVERLELFGHACYAPAKSGMTHHQMGGVEQSAKVIPNADVDLDSYAAVPG
jgi:hypothetical protein